MKKFLSSKKLSISKSTSVLLFVLLAIWTLHLLSDVTQTNMEELYLTPIISDACGWDLYTMENDIRKEISPEDILNLKAGRVFYLSRTLTAEQEHAGYTFLLLDIFRPCAVFLDGELLYTTCPQSNVLMDKVSFPVDYSVTPPAPGESVRCTLPAHFAGRKLTIATMHTYDISPCMPSISLSSYVARSEMLITGTSRELMPAAGFAVITLILAGIWLFAFFQEIHDYSSLLLIPVALTQMLSHLRQFEILTPSSYALDSPLAVFIPLIELLLPLIWLLLQMDGKQNRRIFGCILGISAALSLISPIGGLFGWLPFSSFFSGSNKILYCPLAALLLFTVMEAVRQRNRIFILLLSGLCITACSIAVLYAGSLCSEGFYANQIAYVVKNIISPDPALSLYWCALILFILSSILALYQSIRYIIWMRTDLVLQTEHAQQLDSQLSAQKNFYESRLSHEKELRSLRHDMAGHLNTLAMLLTEDKLTEAKNYLNGILNYHKEQTSKTFCRNPYINAILQNYAAKCQEQHIELVCHIGIEEHELPATELCLILNNALENALEGSLTMPEADRIIKVQAAVRQNLFLLRVSNRFDRQLTMEHDLPVSTKGGKEHGYGLSNIRQAARRRNGDISYCVQNGYFVLDVTFSLE